MEEKTGARERGEMDRYTYNKRKRGNETIDLNIDKESNNNTQNNFKSLPRTSPTVTSRL